jgi:alkylated DNA repair dioxygenase AlkB
MPWHSDQDLTRYGGHPVVASVSFGSERLFCLREKADHANRVEYSLGGGAALLMAGSCQATWQHCVPKRATVQGARISLTFRRVLDR